MKKLLLISTFFLITNLLSAQWIQQNHYYPDSSVLYDIFFIDSQKGWANGTGPETFPELGNYYFTLDGGLNWHSWNDSVWCMFLPMNSIMFANENNGFGIWQNSFYKTSNGGISWWNWTLNPYWQYVFTDIFFTDSMHGWIVGFDEMGLGHGDIKILNTTDGGDYWEEKYSDYIWLIGVDKASVKFIDQYSGWAAMSDGVLYTSDGGNTWNEASLSLYCNSLSIIDENNLWTVGFYYVEGDSYVGGMYNSNDGGISWTKMLGDTIPVLNDITFVNDISGWAVGDSGTILHTEDGGATWVYQASGKAADLHSICFANENEGWICGDSSIILHTDNGGIMGLDKIVSSQNEIHVFPNPSTGITTVNFELESTQDIILMVQNIAGQEIKHVSLGKRKNGIYTLDCTSYSSGIYFVTLQTDSEVVTEKLIVK